MGLFNSITTENKGEYNESDKIEIQKTHLITRKVFKEDFKYYHQNDPQWAKEEMMEGKLGRWGCFLTSLANILSQEGILIGKKECTPLTLLNFLKDKNTKNNIYISKNDNLMASNILKLFEFEYKMIKETLTFSEFKEKVKLNFQDYHIIVEVKFGNGSHFMNIVDFDDKNNQLIAWDVINENFNLLGEEKYNVNKKNIPELKILTENGKYQIKSLRLIKKKNISNESTTNKKDTKEQDNAKNQDDDNDDSRELKHFPFPFPPDNRGGGGGGIPLIIIISNSQVSKENKDKCDPIKSSEIEKEMMINNIKQINSIKIDPFKLNGSINELGSKDRDFSNKGFRGIGIGGKSNKGLCDISGTKGRFTPSSEIPGKNTGPSYSLGNLYGGYSGGLKDFGGKSGGYSGGLGNFGGISSRSSGGLGNLDGISSDYSGGLGNFGGISSDYSGGLGNLDGISRDYSGGLGNFGGISRDYSGGLGNFGGISSDYSGGLGNFGGISRDYSGGLGNFGGGGFTFGGFK